ncbi:MAG: hypothetical protein KGM43_02640 [Planctomycetota bacterium]|nr:hypothetical protein [Planctomycetota bacterium]
MSTRSYLYATALTTLLAATPELRAQVESKLAPGASATPPAKPSYKNIAGSVDHPTVLNVTPTPTANPAFRYRLLTLSADRKPGNAAPVYLRVFWSDKAAEVNAAINKAFDGLSAPAAQFPIDDARKLINEMRFKLEQLKFGSERELCDWGYTLREQAEDSVAIMLPDAQQARVMLRLLCIKAYVDVLDHKYDDALASIRVGFDFSRHVGSGPFLINGLVGIFCFFEMTTHALEPLIAAPNAPNLYWALTALPRPLIPFRDQTELERRLPERMFPELVSAAQPHTPAEWTSLLERLHNRMTRVAATYEPDVAVPPLDQFNAELLPAARQFAQRSHLTPVSDAHLLMLYIADHVATTWDELLKTTYLPMDQWGDLAKTLEQRAATMKTSPLRLFDAMSATTFNATRNRAVLRADRRIAALRVVEALRAHAAATGKLPATLDEVKVVPLPDDPATAKPFVYKLENGAATLLGTSRHESDPGLGYIITLRPL